MDSIILLQKQVLTDVYDILTSQGYEAQTPDNVSISTENGIHRICNYFFNREKIWGYYKYAISFKIRTNYDFNELKEIVSKKVVEELKDAR